jgi:hypothetical protein
MISKRLHIWSIFFGPIKYFKQSHGRDIKHRELTASLVIQQMMIETYTTA